MDDDDQREKGVRASVVVKSSQAFSGDRRRFEPPKKVAGDVLKTFKELEYKEKTGVYAVRLSPTREVFAAGFGDGSVKVIDLESYKELYALQAPTEKTVPILSIRFIPKKDSDVFFATGPIGEIYFSKMTEKTFTSAAVEKNNQTLAMDINSMGDRLATAGSDLVIRIYDTTTMKVSSFYDSDEMNRQVKKGGASGHTLRIQALRYHPTQPDVLISGGWDKMVKIWDRRFSNGLVRTIIGPYIFGEGIDVKDKTLLTASWFSRGGLQLWDMQSGNLIDTLTVRVQPAEPEHLYFGQFCNDSADCRYVLTGGSGNKSVQAIDTSDNEVYGLISFNDPVTCAHNSNCILISGSSGGCLKLTNIEHKFVPIPSKTSLFASKNLASSSKQPSTSGTSND